MLGLPFWNLFQCRKFEGNLAEASAKGTNRSYGGSGGLLGGGGDLAEAVASAASMQFTALLFITI